MGLTKRAWEETQERGWDAEDKYVCVQCLEDDYLKAIVSENVTQECCDYCGHEAEAAIAAPISVVLEPIARVLFAHFEEPANAGLPRDSGEWVDEESITSTRDALESIGLECNEDLLDDIVDSFINNAWYPCAHGHWLGLHEHQALHYAWDSFVNEIKHRSRYFFAHDTSDSSSESSESYPPLVLLRRIASLVQVLSLVKPLAVGTHLYRVRRSAPGIRFEKYEELGPPPREAASAGRMNPPGISYFYLAQEIETALAEVLGKPSYHATIAKFSIEKEATILDLTDLPLLPSIFDGDRKEERDGLIFLEEFINAITSPISRDGREHIDYIPSQVVSEYFAQIYRTDDGKELDGIMYPSAVHAGGKNVVIFPLRDLISNWDDILKLQEVTYLQGRSELTKIVWAFVCKIGSRIRRLCVTYFNRVS